MTGFKDEINTDGSDTACSADAGGYVRERVMPEIKNDFLTGMYLIVRIDESDVDINALNTIQDDCPDFILPFNYKNINGQTEFTYKVGNLNKLQYFYGEVSHAEYITLWKCLLSPLLECRDWFMRPDAFLLDADYLYYNKEKQSIAYIYIPSRRGCSGYDCFTEMAIKVARGIKVNDAVLENKVLRSIIDNFNPNEFLKMLLQHSDSADGGGMQALHGFTETPEREALQVLSVISQADAASDDKTEIYGISMDKGADAAAGEHELRYAERSEQNTCDLSEEIQGGTKDNGFKLFGSKKRKVKESKRNGFSNKLPDNIPVAVPAAPAGVVSVTQETKELMKGTGLRCIGRANLPSLIEVDVAEGGIFTIGRHDVNVGKKRSSFEFDAKTKAVSRRHAAIERNGTGYSIVDLSSSAGTYVDNKKLVPSTPLELLPGNRVSFGNMGADYVWEVS